MLSATQIIFFKPEMHYSLPKPDFFVPPLEGQKCNSTLFQSVVCEASFNESFTALEMIIRSYAKCSKWSKNGFPISAPLYEFAC